MYHDVSSPGSLPDSFYAQPALFLDACAKKSEVAILRPSHNGAQTKEIRADGIRQAPEKQGITPSHTRAELADPKPASACHAWRA